MRRPWMRKIRGRRGILEVDAVDAVFSQTVYGNTDLAAHASPILYVLTLLYF